MITLAGSETTATVLTGATYMLAKNPRVMTKLVTEVENAFADENSIDFVGSASLPYLSAVVDETIRLFPPGPNTQPRITPSGGNMVLGDHIPGNVSRKDGTKECSGGAMLIYYHLHLL